MRCLRILIVFCASTLEDEICQIASKDKAIVKAKLIPLVFFRRHGSATSASFASLRPFFALLGISCISCIGTAIFNKKSAPKDAFLKLCLWLCCRSIWLNILCSNLNMKLAELLLCYRSRCVHHQILSTLIHWECDYLTNVFCICK